MNFQDRLTFFQELISCNQELYYWRYNARGELLSSNCPQKRENILQPIFRASGCMEYALSAQVEEPMILSNFANLVWAAVWERRRGTEPCLHVIGPCLASGLSFRVKERARQAILEAGEDDDYKDRVLAVLDRIPVLTSPVFLHYAAMLGFCVTGKKWALGDLHQQSADLSAEGRKPEPNDRMGVYQAERMLLWTVRNGDVGDSFALDNIAHFATLQPYVPDPLGQAQIAYTILISLCVRAAIEGGLSPEQAYSMGDQYIQKLFLAHTITEAAALKTQMYQEFVKSVHQCRADPGVSKPIQDCRDYIEFHLEEQLTIELLAARLGYTKYYLSRRFKEETGCTVNGYIQIVRMERAKTLLACTDLSVAQIAEKLRFASSSHFSTVFRRLAGESPAQYRASAQTTNL